MDPIGNIPIFLALTRRLPEKEKAKAAAQATLVSLLIICLFGVCGRYILHALHISAEALQLSGGILLFLVAMELLMGKNSSEESALEDSSGVNVALVPLGTPLLAGPGAIVAVMVQVEQADQILEWGIVALSVLAVHFLIWLTMRFSVYLARWLGDGGVLLMTKVAGVLLAAIATQMAADAAITLIQSA